MNKQFTASEVRDLAKRGTDAMQQFIDGRHTLHIPPQSDDADMVIAECLRAMDASADLLEAQEGTVPVVTRESAINAIEYVGRYNGPGRETEARQMLVEGSPSVAHRAPSDAKRLADAVFPSHRACVSYENHPGKRIVGFVIDESHPWWGKCGLTEPLSALEAALATQENPSG